MEAVDALAAAALFAVDPVGSGGVLLRAPAGPAREAWLARLAALLPAGTAMKRMPLHIDDDRLLGGLDLAASLAAAQPVAQRGLLAEVDGGVLVAAMAERLEAGTVARLAAAMDTRQVQLARDGLAGCHPARFGLVALDEGLDDERAAPALGERLAFHVELPARLDGDDGPDASAVARAQQRLAQVHCDDETLEALCRVSSPSGRFFFNNESSKPTDENILTFCKGGFDGVQEGFNQTRGFGFRNVDLALNGTYDVLFGEGHGRTLQERRFCF